MVSGHSLRYSRGEMKMRKDVKERNRCGACRFGLEERRSVRERAKSGRQRNQPIENEVYCSKKDVFVKAIRRSIGQGSRNNERTNQCRKHKAAAQS